MQLFCTNLLQQKVACNLKLNWQFNKTSAAPSQNSRRRSTLILSDIFEPVLINCVWGAFISVTEDDGIVACFQDDDDIATGVGVAGIATIAAVFAEIHIHTATEKRPTSEDTAGDDGKNDERYTPARNGAWRDVAAGKLTAIVAIGITHQQNGEGKHSYKKYNHGDRTFSDQHTNS